MKQTQRISQMEQRLDSATTALRVLSDALDKYAEAQKSIKILGEYYGSPEWRKDFADDEADRLPASLKRGVLTEDAIWDLLADDRELRSRMSVLASTSA